MAMVIVGVNSLVPCAVFNSSPSMAMKHGLVRLQRANERCFKEKARI